ncbi:corticosteroid 11-beta-dehydrogenase isozyme 2 isoform X1 [Thalassophryne amazonica]|uniref:corticosteroid 11-beta-dehydrogenase isozyme 2 isoform X1 n=1 Tax=Thalassophryne amazonica TaxID=390379 RepID=UPI001471F5F7|nr:corticosteroid 11-beta-dehydrogenase isozyme 2 isoform X1 [Thalassophryne amazonica]
MMDDYMLPTWIYLAVLAVIVGSVMKKVLAFHLSSTPALLAWLSFTVLVERLWAFCLPTVLLMALFGLSVWLYSTFRPGALPTLPAHGKAVFITGCDSGFGKAAAMRLDALGFEVFATVLNLSGEGAKELQRTCSPRLTLIQVDITQPQQVQQALLVTKNKLGPNGLWGLVNNAGVCVNFGDAELSLMSNYRGCMEVNFFGTLNVTQSFLPLLRQSKGRLVTISSPAGDQPFPSLAAYGASKAALNLFINTLRHELEPWGIRVSIILPSSYKTGQSSNQAYWEQQHKHLLQTLSPALLEEYGEDYVTETKELFCSYTSTANPDVSPVIDVIVQALLSPQPLVRYFAGPGIGLMYFLHSYCPVIIRDRFIQKLFLKKKLMPRALRKQSSFDINLKFCNNNNEEKVVQPAMHQQ